MKNKKMESEINEIMNAEPVDPSSEHGFMQRRTKPACGNCQFWKRYRTTAYGHCALHEKSTAEDYACSMWKLNRGLITSWGEER